MSGRPLRATLGRPLVCPASHVTSNSARRLSRSRVDDRRRLGAITARGHDLVPAVQLHDAPPRAGHADHQRRRREIVFAHQPRHVISVDAISLGHVRLVQKTVFHVLAHHLISGAIELHRVSTVVPNFYRGSCRAGRGSRRRQGTGWNSGRRCSKCWTKSILRKCRAVGSGCSTRSIPTGFLIGYRPLRPKPNLATRRVRGDDLVSCSSFHRAETYMLTDGTVTVERPRDAAPVNRLPVLIWCATPTVAQLGVAIRADRHRRQGKKKA